jgi:hypothetical protein
VRSTFPQGSTLTAFLRTQPRTAAASLQARSCERGYLRQSPLPTWSWRFLARHSRVLTNAATEARLDGHVLANVATSEAPRWRVPPGRDVLANVATLGVPGWSGFQHVLTNPDKSGQVATAPRSQGVR